MGPDPDFRDPRNESREKFPFVGTAEGVSWPDLLEIPGYRGAGPVGKTVALSCGSEFGV